MIFKRYSLYSFMKSVELVAIGVVPFVQKVVMILILAVIYHPTLSRVGITYVYN